MAFAIWNGLLIIEPREPSEWKWCKMNDLQVECQCFEYRMSFWIFSITYLTSHECFSHVYGVLNKQPHPQNEWFGIVLSTRKLYLSVNNLSHKQIPLHKNTIRVHLVHWMRITIGIVIFITRSKMYCNVITKPIH